MDRTDTFTFIQRSLAIRRTILAPVVEAHMVDCYVDANFYIVKKQTEYKTIILGITKSEITGEEETVTITIIRLMMQFLMWCLMLIEILFY